jgi:hypothetical protein
LVEAVDIRFGPAVLGMEVVEHSEGSIAGGGSVGKPGPRPGARHAKRGRTRHTCSPQVSTTCALG